MAGAVHRLWQTDRGAVAPTIALSLFALVAAGGVAFDYARLASLDTELQQAADQSALAAATQLDRMPGAIERATAAAQDLVNNDSRFASDGGGAAVTVPVVMFYTTAANAEADTNGFTDPTLYEDARFVRVRVAARRTKYALTPLAGVARSGDLASEAVAGLGSAICKTPPVMLCNPLEPATNTDELLDYAPPRGVGLRLVTGSASAPGNFGWLESGQGNQTANLAAALGYNQTPFDCSPDSNVTTKTGMDTAVLDAFNTRFDVYANGAMTCPQQGSLSGPCSPAMNTRKDLVCKKSASNPSQCNGAWNVPSKVYDPWWDSDGNGTSELALLPTDGTRDPAVMGYPHDLCHSSLKTRATCAIQGDGTWDVDAYFRVNYGMNHTQWRAWMGLGALAPDPTRYDVYQYELDHPNYDGSHGINYAQYDSGTGGNAVYAFARPATGIAGVAQSTSQPDRRTIAVAVLNCHALNAKGKTTNVPVPTWLSVFLVEPAINRGTGSTLYTDQKDIYVEFIEALHPTSDDFGSVVRRDVPYLVK